MAAQPLTLAELPLVAGYAASKAVAERLVTSAAEHGVAAVVGVVRLSRLVGHSTSGVVVPAHAARTLKQRPPGLQLV